MDIQHYLTLLAKAREVKQRSDIRIVLEPNGSGWIAHCPVGASPGFDTPKELEQKLIQLGTPPKPETVTITIPFDIARTLAKFANGDGSSLCWTPVYSECLKQVSPHLTASELASIKRPT